MTAASDAATALLYRAHSHPPSVLAAPPVKTNPSARHTGSLFSGLLARAGLALTLQPRLHLGRPVSEVLSQFEGRWAFSPVVPGVESALRQLEVSGDLVNGEQLTHALSPEANASRAARRISRSRPAALTAR